MVIVGSAPHPAGSHQRDRAGPFLQPQACLVQGAHDSRSLGMALWIIVAGKRLRHPQRAAGRQACLSGRLTPVVTHQGYVWAAGALRELALHGHLQSREPMRRRARTTGLITHDLFGLPVQHQDDGDPAAALYHNLGHVDPPPLMGPGRPRCVPARRPLGLEPEMGLDQEVVLPQSAQTTLRLDDPALDDAQVSPDPAIPPAWVVGFELPDTLEQAFMAFGDLEGAASFDPSRSSRLFHSRVSSPTRVFSRVFSLARRASVRVC
jgi:hypothetical protein